MKQLLLLTALLSNPVYADNLLCDEIVTLATTYAVARAKGIGYDRVLQSIDNMPIDTEADIYAQKIGYEVSKLVYALPETEDKVQQLLDMRKGVKTACLNGRIKTKK